MNLSPLGVTDIYASAPIGVLVALGVCLLVVDFVTVHNSYRSIFGALACVAAWVQAFRHHYFMPWPQTAFHGLVYSDYFSFIFFSFILGGGFLTFLLHEGRLPTQRVSARGVDVDALMLFAMAGAMVMVSAANLIVLFLGFELLSVSVYVLAGLARDEKASTEGALKYFILGAFSSAFLLYGMTLVYAVTGSMELAGIGSAIRQDPNALSNPLLLVGLGLMIFGFGFKVSSVPFHFWTPDVYQGAPVSVTGFMAVVVKAAALGSFLRVMYVGFGGLTEIWVGLIWVLSASSMILGNFVALRQRSVKRMLAYSSIAHAGYILMGFLVFRTTGGGEAVIFYILAYSLMTVASFGTVLLVTAGTDAQYFSDDIESFKGMGWRSPFLGFCMVIALLSLGGMPPLAGFLGKFYLFSATVQGGYVGLAIIAALNSVVSLYYYLRVIVVMYFQDLSAEQPIPQITQQLTSSVALALVTIGTIYFGIFSRGFHGAAEQAIRSLGLS